jgi:hypothetical protein
MNHLAGEDRLPQTPTETLTIRQARAVSRAATQGELHASLEPNVDPYGAWSRAARRATLRLVEPHSVTRVLVAFALALVAVGFLAFTGLATVTGSWLVLAGSLLALSGLGNELFRRR